MVSTTVFREVIVIDFWEGHFGYRKLTKGNSKLIHKSPGWLNRGLGLSLPGVRMFGIDPYPTVLVWEL